MGRGGKRWGRNNHPTPPVLLILPQSKGRANKTRQTKIIIIVRCKKNNDNASAAATRKRIGIMTGLEI